MDFFTFIIASAFMFWIYRHDKKKQAKEAEKKNEQELYKTDESKKKNISYQVQAKCPFCQSIEFDLPYKDYIPEDEEELMKCCDCGKLSKFSTLKQNIVDEEIDNIMKIVKNYISTTKKKK